MSGEGVMSMRPVAAVEVPAGGTVSLEPGGLHVMCIDHTDDVVMEATVPLTLTFERSGDVAVEVEIRQS
jgi:copper(I)-binding protein